MIAMTARGQNRPFGIRHADGENAPETRHSKPKFLRMSALTPFPESLRGDLGSLEMPGMAVRLISPDGSFYPITGSPRAVLRRSRRT